MEKSQVQIAPRSPDQQLADKRPDLIHPFAYRWDWSGLCVHHHMWLGGLVMCGLKESHPLHRGEVANVQADEERTSRSAVSIRALQRERNKRRGSHESDAGKREEDVEQAWERNV